MTIRKNIHGANDPYVKMGIVLRKLRKLNGLTISQLAETADVSEKTISNNERGKNCMTIDMIIKLYDSQAFEGRSLEDLVQLFIIDIFDNI